MANPNLAKLKKKAADFEQKKQFDRALSLYIQLLEEAGRDLDDSDLQLFNRVGDLLQRQGNVSEALAYYEKAVDVYAERGFLNNAIALCNKILRQSPARTTVYYKLGKISATKGFKSDAKKNFLEYADRMQKGGHVDEAFRALKEFADLCPDQDDIRLMLAEWLNKENRKSEAIEQLEVLYSKLEAEGRQAEARATIDRIKAIDPDVTPRQSGAWQAQKSNDLVFLDLGGSEPGPRRAAEPPPAPTNPDVPGASATAAAPTSQSTDRTPPAATSRIPALDGLILTFDPDVEEEVPAAPAAELDGLDGLDGLERIASDFDEAEEDPIGAIAGLEPGGTPVEAVAPSPVESLLLPEPDGWTSTDEPVPLVTGLETPRISLSGAHPALSPLIDEPLLSGREFAELSFEEDGEKASTVEGSRMGHDLAIPSDLPLLPTDDGSIDLLRLMRTPIGSPQVAGPVLDDASPATIELLELAPLGDTATVRDDSMAPVTGSPSPIDLDAVEIPLIESVADESLPVLGGLLDAEPLLELPLVPNEASELPNLIDSPRGDAVDLRRDVADVEGDGREASDPAMSRPESNAHRDTLELVAVDGSARATDEILIVPSEVIDEETKRSLRLEFMLGGDETPDAWVEAALGTPDDRSLDRLLTPLGVPAIEGDSAAPPTADAHAGHSVPFDAPEHEPRESGERALPGADAEQLAPSVVEAEALDSGALDAEAIHIEMGEAETIEAEARDVVQVAAEAVETAALEVEGRQSDELASESRVAEETAHEAFVVEPSDAGATHEGEPVAMPAEPEREVVEAGADALVSVALFDSEEIERPASTEEGADVSVETLAPVASEHAPNVDAATDDTAATPAVLSELDPLAEALDETRADAHAETRADAHDETHAEAEAEVHGEAHAEVQGDVHAEVQGDVHAEVQDEAEAEDHGEEHAEVRGEGHTDERGDAGAAGEIDLLDELTPPFMRGDSSEPGASRHPDDERVAASGSDGNSLPRFEASDAAPSPMQRSALDVEALRAAVEERGAREDSESADLANVEGAFEEGPVDLPLLDVGFTETEGMADSADDLLGGTPFSVDDLLSQPPSFESVDTPEFVPDPELARELLSEVEPHATHEPVDAAASGESALPETTDEWPADAAPEVLIDGEWRDEHMGDLVSGEVSAIVGPSGDRPNRSGPRFDDLSAALMWPPSDDEEAPGKFPGRTHGSTEEAFARAHVQRSTVSFGGVEAQLRRRLELDPGNLGLRRQLGEALLDQGSREEGLLELDLAMRGYEQVGDLEGARSVADIVLRVIPASVRHHQKRVEYAVRSNDRVRLVEAYVELADSLFRSGEPDKARVVYSRVLELSPGNGRARFALGLLSPEETDAAAARAPGASVPVSPEYVLGLFGRSAPEAADEGAGRSSTVTSEISVVVEGLFVSPPTTVEPRPEVSTDDAPQGEDIDGIVSRERASADASGVASEACEDDVRHDRTSESVGAGISNELIALDAVVEGDDEDRRVTPFPAPSLDEEIDAAFAEPPVVAPVTPAGAGIVPSPADYDFVGTPPLGAAALATPFATDEEGDHRAASLDPSATPDFVSPLSFGLREAGALDAASASLHRVESVTASIPADTSPMSGDDEFIDLGSWLREDEPVRSTRMVTAEAPPTGDEQADFDEMLRRFKQGVAENMDEEDYDAHYDLGVAYKEMGLTDEAIAEFQKALRGESNRVRSYEALGQCFVEKGQLQVAITLLRRAAETTGADDQQLVGVLYLLGYASEVLARHADALGYYQRVFAVDIEFRDVAQRVAAMEHQTQ